MVQLGARLDIPNRLFSMAGRAAGKRDNDQPPIYHLPSFVRHLDGVSGVSWATFVHDVTPLLWAIDNDYPFKHLLQEHVAWFDGHFRPPHLGQHVHSARSSGDAAQCLLDRSELRGSSHRSDAPHLAAVERRPSAVRRLAGQALVLKTYDALASSKLWAKTLLIITYDEHGGFFDHVPPPLDPPDDNPEVFNRYGVRVPAIVVSPFVGKRSFSHATFDHTSIIKTILLRFARTGTSIPDMGLRVSRSATPRSAADRSAAPDSGNAGALPAAREQDRRQPQGLDQRAPHARRHAACRRADGVHRSPAGLLEHPGAVHEAAHAGSTREPGRVPSLTPCVTTLPLTRARAIHQPAATTRPPAVASNQKWFPVATMSKSMKAG